MTGDAMWRTSSYSGGSGGDCVEVRGDTGRVLVRDTKDCTGPVLPFTPQAWRRFADRVKRSLAGPKARHLRAPSRLEGARSAVLTKPTLLPWPKIGPVIATISGRRRDATVRAMHAERRIRTHRFSNIGDHAGAQITRFGFPASPSFPFLSGMAQPARACCIAHRAAAARVDTPILV
jgi:Domain of unknown function (DUF397)